MKRTLAKETVDHVGESVTLQGWIDSRRDHGKIVFLDIRDRSGIVQTVVLRTEQAKDIRSEFVVEITGQVNKRPPKMVNPNIETGTVEVEVKELKILSRSKELPIPIDTDGYAIDEEIRLKYRYLDLRRKRMTDNIRMRSKVAAFMR